MTLLRALLACVWVLMSLTATATPAAPLIAGVPAVQGHDMPCHQTAGDRRGRPEPSPVKGPAMAMPCCGQPVLAAAPMPILLPSRSLQPLRLKPAVAAPLIGLPVRLEPRPPKFA